MQGLNEYQESKLQMSTQYMYLYENDLDILYAYYNDAAVECTWTSQNEDVATVKDGVITAKRKAIRLSQQPQRMERRLQVWLL